ncbi:MAG: hypothetical protein IJL46_07095 [Clostridia bacterium]|nr:hypothetical protein [Clostridia bacterium]MBQ5957317.1 hypothetical protein [Clostridia bacterium]
MKDYVFWGWDSEAVAPVNERYKAIKDQRELYDLMKDCWTVETCTPRMRDIWSEEDMTQGQCTITSFLVQDIFGGKVYGVPLKNGGIHCYNVVGDVKFDITSEQFHGEKLEYTLDYEQSREAQFSSEEKYGRYLLLKKNLDRKLGLED